MGKDCYIKSGDETLRLDRWSVFDKHFTSGEPVESSEALRRLRRLKRQAPFIANCWPERKEEKKKYFAYWIDVARAFIKRHKTEVCVFVLDEPNTGMDRSLDSHLSAIKKELSGIACEYMSKKHCKPAALKALSDIAAYMEEIATEIIIEKPAD
jgi:hypothetical protein